MGNKRAPNDGGVIEPTLIPREIESLVETAPPPPVHLGGVGVPEAGDVARG